MREDSRGDIFYMCPLLIMIYKSSMSTLLSNIIGENILAIAEQLHKHLSQHFGT